MFLLFLKKIKVLFVTIGVIILVSGYVYFMYRVMMHYPREKRSDIGFLMVFLLFIIWVGIIGICYLTKWLRKQWLEAEHEKALKDINISVVSSAPVGSRPTAGFTNGLYTVELREDLKRRVEAEDKETQEMEAKRTAPKPEVKSEPETGGGRYRIAIGKNLKKSEP